MLPQLDDYDPNFADELFDEVEAPAEAREERDGGAHGGHGGHGRQGRRGGRRRPQQQV